MLYSDSQIGEIFWEFSKLITEEQLIKAKQRVDAASEEAVELAMDALHDRAIEQALWDRIMKNHGRNQEDGMIFSYG